MKIQDFCESMCLAACYSWIANHKEYGKTGKAIDLKIVTDVINAYYNGLVDNECTVLDGNAFLDLCDPKHKHIVTKKDISTIQGITGPYPVRFDYGKLSHWVVVEKGEIVFDSKEYSNCVAKGKPSSVRVIEVK